MMANTITIAEYATNSNISFIYKLEMIGNTIRIAINTVNSNISLIYKLEIT